MILESLPDPVVIGVTGHRNIDEDDPVLRRIVKAEIERIRRDGHDGRDRRVTMLSCLAEGADRLVADVAVEACGATLIAPLPFLPEEYEKDFESPRSKAGFRRFLGMCDEWKVVGGELLAEEDRSSHYALAGAYLVASCDALIAIWDGEPARGIGGTAELVDWVRQGFVPEEYRQLVGASSSVAGTVVHIDPQSYGVVRFSK